MKNGEYTLVLAPENFSGNIYRKKYCYEHHLIYWKYTGVVPKEDECIHHVNENKRDNKIENLELLKIKDHVIYHTVTNGKNILICKCPGCGSIFKKDKNKVKKNSIICCSRECIGLYTAKVRRNPKVKDILKKENIIEYNKEFRHEELKFIPKILLDKTIEFIYGEVLKKEPKVEKICSICGKNHVNKLYCSEICFNLARRKVVRPSKKELEVLVWEIPACEIAKTYGIADTVIGKWCKAYKIKKPPRGYWQKKKAGLI